MRPSRNMFSRISMHCWSEVTESTAPQADLCWSHLIQDLTFHDRNPDWSTLSLPLAAETKSPQI